MGKSAFLITFTLPLSQYLRTYPLFTTLGELLSNSQASSLPHPHVQSAWNSHLAASWGIDSRGKVLLESFCSNPSAQHGFKLESQTLARGQMLRWIHCKLSYRIATAWFRIEHLSPWLLAYFFQSEANKQWAADPAPSMHDIK
jgi:hypothetical protein